MEVKSKFLYLILLSIMFFDVTYYCFVPVRWSESVKYFNQKGIHSPCIRYKCNFLGFAKCSQQKLYLSWQPDRMTNRHAKSNIFDSFQMMFVKARQIRNLTTPEIEREILNVRRILRQVKALSDIHASKRHEYVHKRRLLRQLLTLRTERALSLKNRNSYECLS